MNATGPVDWETLSWLAAFALVIGGGVWRISTMLTKLRHDMRSEYQAFVNEGEDKLQKQIDYLRGRMDGLINGKRRD